MKGLPETASAFVQTLWLNRRGMSRTAFKQWQQKQLSRWLQQDLPKVNFYQNHPASLDALPIIDKAIVMENFERFNQGRITQEEGWQILQEGGRFGTVNIGVSTGTSGNRTLYAITQKEQYRWLGTMLAKTIPGFLFEPERVAIILPQNSALYETANQTKRIQLRFYGLLDGMETWYDDLLAFQPTTIVAPPRMLRHLADLNAPISPRRLYAGGETLDPLDKARIEAYFSQTLGQIYMASEGLFAVTCRHNRLHLTEDANVFEFEPVTGNLVSPLITSFRRSYQIMARYRINDLLRLSDEQCPCGSPLQVIEEVIGRMDDTYQFTRSDGSMLLITPDILRTTILDASRAIEDFRLIRQEHGRIELWLHQDLPKAEGNKAKKALEALFGKRGHSHEVHLIFEKLPFETSRKLRRVEWRQGGKA